MVYDTELNVSMSRVEVTKQLVAQERHRMGVKLICSKIRAVLIEAAVPYYLWKVMTFPSGGKLPSVVEGA